MTTAPPALTLKQIKALGPCQERFDELAQHLPKRGKITVAKAAECGATLDDLEWIISVASHMDSDIERRGRLWVSDCNAHVLRLFEGEMPDDDRPHKAIEAARQFARGEIGAAALDAACYAARDAAAAEGAPRGAEWAAAAAAAATWDAAEGAAGDVAAAAAGYAARDAEKTWQLERLIARFSEPEPEDWPLKAQKGDAA